MMVVIFDMSVLFVLFLGNVLEIVEVMWVLCDG